MKYKECRIKPATGGFGMWQVEEYAGDDYDTAEDILSAVSDNGIDCYEIGVDALPEGGEDIRGKIYNQPDRVFCFVQDGYIQYFGIKGWSEGN